MEAARTSNILRIIRLHYAVPPKEKTRAIIPVISRAILTILNYIKYKEWEDIDAMKYREWEDTDAIRLE